MRALQMKAQKILSASQLVTESALTIESLFLLYVGPALLRYLPHRRLVCRLLVLTLDFRHKERRARCYSKDRSQLDL